MRYLKAFGERIAARDPDRQTAEIQIRIALMKRFSALGTAEHGPGLLIFRLRLDKSHLRALCRYDDHLGVSSIVFLPPHERSHLLRRDQPDLMAQLADLMAQEMSTPASFHRNDAGRQLAEERQHLIPSQLLAQHRPPGGVSPMRLKHILRKVDPDRGNLRHDRSPLWILADPPWHTDAVGGGGYIINVLGRPRYRSPEPKRKRRGRGN